MKINKWALGYAAGLAALTIYMSLDTFVFHDVYEQNATLSNSEMFENIEESKTEPVTKTELTKETDETGNAFPFPGGWESKEKPEGWENGEKPESRGSGEKTEETGHRPPKPGGKNSKNGSNNEKDKTDKTDNTDKTDKSDKSDKSDKTVTEKKDLSAGKENSNNQGNSNIGLTQYRYLDTDVYVADVTVSSAEYIKTAFANDTYGKNITAATSEIAASNNAVLAINGDYYGAREKGYVIRNGIVYRDTPGDSDVLCIYADGSMEIVSPSEYTAEELVNRGVWQAFSFGPGLVENGEIIVSDKDEVGRSMASNPRTAVGMIDKNHYVFVVADGRTSENDGLSIEELAAFMKELGVTCAYNLDGGGSSTMVYNGEVINNPTTNGNRIKERAVSDIIYIAAQ